MNPKFFDVKKDKQDAIINAALKIFAENGYKKSSTDIIVKEAGISKGLLFHYFVSKQGLYEFVYDYSVKYMMLELTQSVKRGEKDFFEIQRQIELAKTRVMKNYPYMQQFLSGIKFETGEEALEAIEESKGILAETYDNIYRQADLTMFYSMIDVSKVVNMIGWMSEGFIKDKFREGNPDLDEMNAEFAQYLSMLRDSFYKGTGQGLSAVIDNLESGNDSVVMDSIRDALGKKAVSELTFEERLAAGKKPLVEIPDEEKEVEKEVKKESEKEDLADTSENEIKDIAKEAMADSINKINERDLNKTESVSAVNEDAIPDDDADTNADLNDSENDAVNDSDASAEEAAVVNEASDSNNENNILEEETDRVGALDDGDSEHDRRIKEVGPAPKLPEINSETINKMTVPADDADDGMATYYPLRF